MSKLSYYNFYFKNPNGIPTIYNTRTNSALKLTPELSLDQALANSGIILDETIDELRLYEYDSFRHRYCNKTLWMTIAPTMKCNFNCSYCFNQGHDSKVMDKDTADRLIRLVETSLPNINDIFIWWFGGEPTLALDVFGYISSHLIKMAQIYRKGYRTHFYSNGYLLDDGICRFIKKHGVARLHVVLDGDREHHNRRRFSHKDHNTYDQILKNVLIAEKYFDDIGIRINVDKTNIESIYNILSDFKQYGLSTKKVHPSLGQVIIMNDEDYTYDDRCLNNEEFAHAAFSFESESRKYGYTDYTCDRYITSRRHNFCMADVLNSFTINPQGDLARCNKEFDNPKYFTGNVCDGKLECNQVHINYITNTPFKDARCSKCKYLPICSGGCRRRANGSYKFRCTLGKFILPELIAARLSEEYLTPVELSEIPQLSSYM